MDTKEKLKLIVPSPEMKDAALAFRQEFFDCGEDEVHGDGGLYQAENYERWLKKILADRRRNDRLLVPTSTYFACAGDRIVGAVQIRHRLNDRLQLYSGHIGYSVRPSERRKGYATRILTLALEKCRRLRIEKALVVCEKWNTGSEKTILRNDGVLENEMICEDGAIIRRYWIDLV